MQESNWNQMLFTLCDVMNMDTLKSSAAVVMYTMEADASVQALTALDQDNGVARSVYA